VHTQLLTTFAEKLGTEPEEAISLASGNVQWLLSRNLPAMAQRLLNDVPDMRHDKGVSSKPSHAHTHTHSNAALKLALTVTPLRAAPTR